MLNVAVLLSLNRKPSGKNRPRLASTSDLSICSIRPPRPPRNTSRHARVTSFHDTSNHTSVSTRRGTPTHSGRRSKGGGRGGWASTQMEKERTATWRRAHKCECASRRSVAEREPLRRESARHEAQRRAATAHPTDATISLGLDNVEAAFRPPRARAPRSRRPHHLCDDVLLFRADTL